MAARFAIAAALAVACVLAIGSAGAFADSVNNRACAVDADCASYEDKTHCCAGICSNLTQCAAGTCVNDADCTAHRGEVCCNGACRPGGSQALPRDIGAEEPNCDGACSAGQTCCFGFCLPEGAQPAGGKKRHIPAAICATCNTTPDCEEGFVCASFPGEWGEDRKACLTQAAIDYITSKTCPASATKVCGVDDQSGCVAVEKLTKPNGADYDESATLAMILLIVIFGVIITGCFSVFDIYGTLKRSYRVYQQ